MLQFEKQYEEACLNGQLPGVALLAANKDGTFQYANTFGVRSLKTGKSKPMTGDTVFALASCTKLMTAIAVLQCVGRGQLDLDADVNPVLPEVGSYGILKGWDEGNNEPVLIPKIQPVTLRQLLSHTSGQIYDLASPDLLKWRGSRGETGWQGATIVEKTMLPLVFAPGSSWAYGGGMDWAGKMVERVTHRSLEEYLKEHVWDVLGMNETSFWPKSQPSMQGKMADLSMLNESGEAIDAQDFDINYGTKECIGGGGAFASPMDFFKVLTAVLREDERLLSPELYTELFKPQLDDHCANVLTNLLREDQEWSNALSHNLSISTPKNFTFAGMISLTDEPGWLKAKSIVWGGLPCIVWFIDRATGLCALAASQVLPAQAPPIMLLHRAFQREIFDVYKRSKNLQEDGKDKI